MAQDDEHRPVRIAIIGDPHFVAKDHALAGGSWLQFEGRDRKLVPSQPIQHPWLSLEELARNELSGQEFEAVLCVGDLSSGGDKVALETGWTHLNTLAATLKAKVMACASGNHDVRSRSMASEVTSNPVRNLGNARGANEHLRMLNPAFPIVLHATLPGVNADDLRTKYFGNQLAFVETSALRIAVVDSCCEHNTDNQNYEKGAFPPSAQREMIKALAEATQPKLNVLVCHHPPTSHGYFGENPYDFISGGGEMLSLLERHGPWLVVHGHKHHGHITYAPGGGRSPVVFAASSLGNRYDVIGDGHRNQFYVVELEDRGGDIVGAVRAWDWFNGSGFQPATRKNGGIFDGCGFGWRRSPAEVAAKIAEATAGRLPVKWPQMLELLPEMAHVLPSDYPLIESALLARHAVAIEKDAQQTWGELAKAAP